MHETYIVLVDRDYEDRKNDKKIVLKVVGERELTAEDIDHADECVDNLWEDQDNEDFFPPDTDTCIQAVTETLEARGFKCSQVLAEYTIEW